MNTDPKYCFLPINRYRLLNLNFFKEGKHGRCDGTALIRIRNTDIWAVLWNRNYFLRFRFRFRLLKSYGSGSDFWKSYGSGSGSYFWKVTVPVPVPAPYLYHKKQIFLKKFVSFLHSKLFYKEKDYKYQKIYCKMWKKKMLNEGNQTHNFISSFGSGTVINYGSGSGSDFLTSYGSGSGSTRQKLRFLRFRFRFHNTVFEAVL